MLTFSRDNQKGQESHSIGERDRIKDLKSQVHSITQEDDGEYEYGDQVLDEVDMFDDDDDDYDVTQGNSAEKLSNNHTSTDADTAEDMEELDKQTNNETPRGNSSENHDQSDQG